MKKLFGFIATFILTCSLALPIFASALSVEFRLPDTQQEKLQDVAGKLMVSKFLEDNNNYYLLLNSIDHYGAIAIGKAKKFNNDVTIYSVYSEVAMKGYTIEDFTVNSLGDIWLQLKGNNGRFMVIRSDAGIEFTEFDASYAVLGDNCGIWISEGNAYIWNGNTIDNFVLPLQHKRIAAIAWHDGALFYLDGDGNIHKVWYDNHEYFFSLSEIFHIDKFVLEQSSLISCGGKLWLSAAISYSSTDGNILDKIAYSGLVDIYANTVIALEGQADTIKYAAVNEDGSINFLMAKVFPIIPNPPPGEMGENSYWIGINSSGKIDIEPDNEPVSTKRQYFEAQDGTLWHFGTKPGITAVKPDGTEISYVPAGALPQNDITVLFNGTKVGFDVSPYIEKGYTMVPIRGVSSLLGLRADWNSADKKITLTGNETEISLAIGQLETTVNGKAVNMDVPAEIQKGRTMVPLRFISEVFGAGIRWDNESRTIIITK